MQSFNLRQYLVYGVLIIRATPLVLYLLVLTGAGGAAARLLENSPMQTPVSVLFIILSIVVTPVIYGIFFQLIEDRYTSIPDIVKTYLLAYIWLLIRMYLPVIILVSLLLPLLPNQGAGFLEITLVFFSLLYLYVIPTYYFTGTQQGAIARGISFLLKNLGASAPLILAMLAVESAMLLFQYAVPALQEATPYLAAALDFALFCTGSLIDFLIFIMLIYILKFDASGAAPSPG